MLQDKADEIVVQHDNHTFKASNGWLDITSRGINFVGGKLSKERLTILLCGNMVGHMEFETWKAGFTYDDINCTNEIEKMDEHIKENVNEMYSIVPCIKFSSFLNAKFFFIDTSKKYSQKNRKFQLFLNSLKNSKYFEKFLSYNHMKNRFFFKQVLRKNSSFSVTFFSVFLDLF
ncbi:hypothetical protein AGLY_001705 [Aphis glycines]|uniref:Uncharacterized protein n=1 Tax=Aphis glycines TaxID=307491 RepID=A0A6G0U716_APHGL|nr:hypothetical protein AGLY_001705 [Aphis glycines]